MESRVERKLEGWEELRPCMQITPVQRTAEQGSNSPLVTLYLALGSGVVRRTAGDVQSE